MKTSVVKGSTTPATPKGQWVFKETDSDSGWKFHINMRSILKLY